MARRVNGLQRPAVAFDHCAVLHPVIRHEVAVRTLFDRRPLPAPVRTEAVARRPGRGLDMACRRRMIDVGVSHDKMRHGLAAHGGEHGIDMVSEVRASIDDRHIALPHDVSAGAVEGEDARVVRDDPADQLGDLRHLAVGEVEIPDVGDRLTHGAALSWACVWFRTIPSRCGSWWLGWRRVGRRRPVEWRRAMGIIAPPLRSNGGPEQQELTRDDP